MSLPPMLPKLATRTTVTPQLYQTQLAILRYSDGSWSLAVEFWYRGQTSQVPTRLVLPESVARHALFGNAILEKPYHDPDLIVEEV